ncbi:hypothetical protein [Acinetobacter beijerinckii]|uniref:Uncharacterized protein n=1 Tax=Acinetobacter beijerinckii CIP 110307 TaxID=1217648 RepID=N9FEA6_9GAMM|nr:hypothetical protein [Acinetobacter beijerinckii]ENW03209.1 hypothetical protein F933_03239 [Acinetobacter beijerinckii CIP 110307]
MENNLIDVRKGLLLLEQHDKNADFDILDVENKVNILNYALSESVSIYWPNLALNWIEKNPYIISNSLENVLLELANKSWVKQAMKQKIRRLLKRS